MVEKQIIGRGIENQQVIKAMMEVPRHLFVPDNLQNEAYNDYPLPIGEAQTISQPYMVAKMAALLGTQDNSRVLEIGTGSAYQAAVLAEIVQHVFTIEWVESLAKKAENLTEELGYDNISVKTGDGSIGWPEHAPYDSIIVTAAAPELPPPLITQLREGGVIVAPIGNRVLQTLTKMTKVSGELQEENLFDCMFVPLLGTHGWNN
jgi:protein-L-isoaspartate(D-aspartate) O-methyltransferase